MDIKIYHTNPIWELLVRQTDIAQAVNYQARQVITTDKPTYVIANLAPTKPPRHITQSLTKQMICVL